MYLEERKIEEACRHEAATAMATPEEQVLQIASHYREAPSVGSVLVVVVLASCGGGHS